MELLRVILADSSSFLLSSLSRPLTALILYIAILSLRLPHVISPPPSALLSDCELRYSPHHILSPVTSSHARFLSLTFFLSLSRSHVSAVGDRSVWMRNSEEDLDTHDSKQTHKSIENKNTLNGIFIYRTHT